MATYLVVFDAQTKSYERAVGNMIDAEVDRVDKNRLEGWEKALRKEYPDFKSVVITGLFKLEE